MANLISSNIGPTAVIGDLKLLATQMTNRIPNQENVVFEFCFMPSSVGNSSWKTLPNYFEDKDKLVVFVNFAIYYI